MYYQWLGLEHVGLHPNPQVQAGWKGKTTLNGIGPFLLRPDTEISNAILITSPAWFEIQAVKADGVTNTLGATYDDHTSKIAAHNQTT
jgi:hypothetical protein